MYGVDETAPRSREDHLFPRGKSMSTYGVIEALPGGGSRVACLNFKMSPVGVLSKLRDASEIERKSSVLVGSLVRKVG